MTILHGFKAIFVASIIALFVVGMINQISNDLQYDEIMQDISELKTSFERDQHARNEELDRQISKLNISKIQSSLTKDKIRTDAMVVEEAALDEDVVATEYSLGYGDLSFEDMYTVQVNKSYRIPEEFYYDVLPESMHPLISGVCEAENNTEISSMFLLAVAATEVGWGTAFYEPGSNNWFNWTADACTYQTFSSTDACVTYTQEKFQERFFNREWYAGFGQELSDDIFTVPEVNTRYALYNDCTVNWYWSDVVCEIMYSFNLKYQEWRMTHCDM